MKILPIVFAFFAASVFSRAAATVYISKEVSSIAASDIEKHAVALLMSCDFEAPVDLATEARWKAALAGPNVHTVFDKPRKLTFIFSTTGPAKSQEVAVKEILVPVPTKGWTDWILVASEGRVRAFSKYRHDALYALLESLTSH